MSHRVAALVSVALCALAASASHAEDAIVLRAGRVITVSGQTFAPGEVLVVGGAIAEVGRKVPVPEGATVVEAPEGVVIPGLVAAFSTLAEGSRDTLESLTPDLCVSEALDSGADWRRLLAAGVTTAYLSPATGRVVPGCGAVARLSEAFPTARVVLAPSALRIVLGEWPKDPPMTWDPPLPPSADNASAPPLAQLPTTRAGTVALLRELFIGAREESEADSVRAALAGTLPVRVRCDRVEDIRTALELADDFGLRIVIEGGAEAWKLADELGRRKVPVVLLPSPRAVVQESGALGGATGEERADAACILARAGVPLAVAGDDASLPALLRTAARLVGQGLTVDQALRAVTLGAAEVLGVASGSGSIEKGKGADLVLLSGDPLASRTRVLATLSGGRIVYDARAGGAAAPAIEAVVRARRILLGGGGAIADGELRLAAGKIVSVGPRAEPPPGARVLDFGEATISPGLIDTQSHLGLRWESDEPTFGPGRAFDGPASARTAPLAAALDLEDPAFAEALRAGVTTVAVSPSASGLFCGSVSLVKTAGASREERLLAPVAAMLFSVGDLRGVSGVSDQARDLLTRAKAYDTQWTAFDKRWAEFERKLAAAPDSDVAEVDRPGRNAEMELLRTLFRERVPALVAAQEAPLLEDALDVFEGEFGLRVALLGATDSFRAIEELGGRGATCVFGPEVTFRERGRETCLPATAARAGIPVCFRSQGARGGDWLRLTAAEALAGGMSGEDALRALTANPARLFGMADRIGTLEAGRDADFVVFSGDPLELTSQVRQVWVSGRLAWDAEGGTP